MKVEISTALLQYFVKLMEKDNSVDSRYFLPLVKDLWRESVINDINERWKY